MLLVATMGSRHTTPFSTTHTYHPSPSFHLTGRFTLSQGTTRL
jgi:hypothetical protein